MEAMTTLFFEAIKQGKLDDVESILALNPDLARTQDAGGLSPVLTAIYYGQPAIADRIIASGAPLTLFEASAAGRLSEVRALLEEAPAQVNAWAPDGFQPLGLACFFGHTEVVEFLLARGAEVNYPS